jgi:GAF domain-containing protein
MSAPPDSTLADPQRIIADLRRQLTERTAELQACAASRDAALAREAAAAEVLQVINSFPGDLSPVFQTMLEKGARLCDASHGILGMYEGDGFRGVATVGFPPDAAEGLSRVRKPPPGTTLARAQELQQTVQIADISLEPGFAPVFAANPSLQNARTNLVVPMLKERQLVGAILFYREVVRPFSDQQIGLLENFAAQAVIAMENARLLTETHEALEQQTATAEVLGVINSSPGNLAPVFDAILEKAHSLCGADHGSLTVYDGQHFYAVATRGMPEAFAALLRRPRPASDLLQERLLAGEGLVHIVDLAENPTRDGGVNEVTAAGIELGIRTLLFVPLRKDGALLG